MVHVRRHKRQLGSGKTVAVRQHERTTPEHAEVREHDPHWYNPQPVPGNAGDHPAGTRFFREDGNVMAWHPDGTVHPTTDDPDPVLPPVKADEVPEGTWFLESDGQVFAVFPDGSAHPVADDEPEPDDDVIVHDEPAGPRPDVARELVDGAYRELGISPDFIRSMPRGNPLREQYEQKLRDYSPGGAVNYDI